MLGGWRHWNVLFIAVGTLTLTSWGVASSLPDFLQIGRIVCGDLFLFVSIILEASDTDPRDLSNDLVLFHMNTVWIQTEIALRLSEVVCPHCWDSFTYIHIINPAQLITLVHICYTQRENTSHTLHHSTQWCYGNSLLFIKNISRNCMTK